MHLLWFINPKAKIIIWASLAACLCAVSVAYAVIYKNNFNKPVNNSEVLSTTNSSSDFHIYSLPKVLSENSENSKQKVLLSPVMTLLDSNTGIHAITYTVDFKSDGSPYDERDTSYSGNIIKQDLFDISPDSIEFSIASDAVEYYNVTVKIIAYLIKVIQPFFQVKNHLKILKFQTTVS